jgi:uncharacterized protein YciI
MKISVKFLPFILFVFLVQSHEASCQTIVDDAYVQQQLAVAKAYTLVFLKKGPKHSDPNAKNAQMAHLKYLFELKEQGKLAVFGPLTDDGDLRGIGIFTSTDVKEVERLLNEDAHVKEGHLVYEIHPWFGVPGQSLPK